MSSLQCLALAFIFFFCNGSSYSESRIIWFYCTLTSHVSHWFMSIKITSTNFFRTKRNYTAPPDLTSGKTVNSVKTMKFCHNNDTIEKWLLKTADDQCQFSCRSTWGGKKHRATSLLCVKKIHKEVYRSVAIRPFLWNAAIVWSYYLMSNLKH